MRRQRKVEDNADEIAVESLSQAPHLYAVFKLGQVHAYGACPVPPALSFTKLSFKELDKGPRPCAHIDWLMDYDETMTFEQPVENLIFDFDGKASFRVIPKLN